MAVLGVAGPEGLGALGQPVDPEQPLPTEL